MSARVTIALLLLAAKLSWPQVEPSGTGGAANTDDDSQMMTPPPVSGEAYPTTVGSEERSNYLSTGIAVIGAYITNAVPGATANSVNPVNDGVFSIFPTFALSQSTPRQQTALSYSPSFVIYEPTTSRDTIDQGAALTYRYRLSQHVTLNVGDSFFRTSDVFDQSSTFSSGTITGSTQTSAPTVIAPFAESMSNSSARPRELSIRKKWYGRCWRFLLDVRFSQPVKFIGPFKFQCKRCHSLLQPASIAFAVPWFQL